MNREEIMKILEDQDSIASTGLRKVATIERRRKDEPLNAVSETEFLDVVSERGCGRIEWRKLPVTDDNMVLYKPEDVAGTCSQCRQTQEQAGRADSIERHHVLQNGPSIREAGPKGEHTGRDRGGPDGQTLRAVRSSNRL